MPRILRRDTQPGFAKGLNTSADESQLGEDEVRLAENARLTEYGGITKRLGTQRALSSSPTGQPITSGFTWRKSTPASHLLVSNGHLITAPHGVYPLTTTDQGGGLDNTTFADFASFRDISKDVVYIADGGQLNKWDGGTLTVNLPGTPNISRVAVHNQRLFACGDPANTETLYYSGLSNGDTLGAVGSDGGSVIIRTFASEPLTGLMSVGQSLLIFHERGISRFTGWSQDDFTVSSGTRGVTQDVGTISPRSLVPVENGGFFASDRGVYSVTESGVSQISSKIESLLAAVTTTNLRSVSAAHNRRNREVWFAIPSLGVMIYNYRLEAWSGPFTGTYVTNAPITLWESGADVTPTILFGCADGIFRQADVDQLFLDDVLADATGGVPYTMTVQCHRMFYGDDATEKSLRFIYVNGNLRGSTGAAVTWETGQFVGSVVLPASGAASLWGAETWGLFDFGSGGSTSSRVQANGSGKYNDIKLIDSGSSSPVFSRVEGDAFDMGRRY